MKYLRKFDSVSDMETAIASSEIDILGLAYNNDTPVMRIKSGGSPVPPTPPVTKATPFYIEDVSGSENTLQIMKNNSNPPTLTIEKSTDGETWESMGKTSTTAITATIPANGRLYLRCGNKIRWSTPTGRNMINTTGNCNVGGNIMSLLYGSSFTGNETTFTSGSHTFSYLFYNNTHLVDASNLLLLATKLDANTYCYYSMFGGCTSLTTAPNLPARTLGDWCYGSMFEGCTNLNYIKCLATNIGTSAQNCTTNWVQNVASTGTFVKNPSMSSWTTGVKGIPSGWTVQDATA